jgi:hypothetical protein
VREYWPRNENITMYVTFLLLTFVTSAKAAGGGGTPCANGASGFAGGSGTYGCLKDLAKAATPAGTCGGLKNGYKAEQCCGTPMKATSVQLVPNAPVRTVPNIPASPGAGGIANAFGGSNNVNPCLDSAPRYGQNYATTFDNIACYNDENALVAFEQSGTNVTVGYKGAMDVSGKGYAPITESYASKGLCPVNVHWHLGSEHYSVGEYDENGVGPDEALDKESPRRLAASSGDRSHIRDARRLADVAQIGFRCTHYDKNDARFTTEYDWHHCQDMHVGETYEVHWPHSAAGDCGTPNQFQSPFYDGVFCKVRHGDALVQILNGGGNLSQLVGVQAQIFTIINDDSYHYPDLMRGAIADGDMWQSVSYYTGSTTGPSRTNTVCAAYTPITWQVDRKCHLISASSFDKMCADMKTQRDDMTGDIYPHGARALVPSALAANNHQRRL